MDKIYEEIKSGRLSPVSDSTVKCAFSDEEGEGEFILKKGVGRPKRQSKISLLEALFDDPSINLPSRRNLSKIASGSQKIELEDFHRACKYGQVNNIENLLKKEVDGGEVLINSSYGSEGNTALHLAVSSNQIEAVKLLLLNGANIQQKNISGNIASQMTVKETTGVYKQISELLLHWKTYTKHARNNTLWGMHVDDDFKVDLDIYTDSSLNNLLHYCAIWNHFRVMEKLLQNSYSSEIDSSNKFGFTPLMEACRFNSLECVDLLLNAGANFSLKNNSSLPALNVFTTKAVRKVFRKFIKENDIRDDELIEAARPFSGNQISNEKTSFSETPIKYSGREERKLQQTVKIIDRTKQATKRKKGLGRPPKKQMAEAAQIDPVIYKIASSGNLHEILYHMSSYPESLSRSEKSKKSPLLAASQHGHIKIVKELVRQGAKVEVCDENGNSCLHLAASNDHLSIIKYLLDIGVDPDKTNNSGKFPRDLTSNLKIRQILFPTTDLHLLDFDRPLLALNLKSEDDTFYFLAEQIESIFNFNFPGESFEHLNNLKIKLDPKVHSLLEESTLFKKFSTTPTTKDVWIIDRDSTIDLFRTLNSTLSDIPLMYVDLQKIGLKYNSSSTESMSPVIQPPKMKLKSLQKNKQF